jgi:hypothetical protein
VGTLGTTFKKVLKYGNLIVPSLPKKVGTRWEQKWEQQIYFLMFPIFVPTFFMVNNIK